MNILIANNFYGSSAPSGEASVLEAERGLLLQRGHKIVEFFRHSDEIRHTGIRGVVIGGLATPWNPFSAMRLRKTVEANNPDVVHIHNTFPLISPSIFRAIGHRAPRVLTLHNYRLFCPAAIPMRNNQVCTECIHGRSVLPALKHGCYRNSRLATAPLATSVALHRSLGTWTRHVDAFIALTEFQRALMIEAGLPAELVHVKPNFYPGRPQVVGWPDRAPAVVYAGRISSEKGVDDLVRAWALWGESAPPLRIVGDGDSRPELEALVASAPDARVHFLGQLSADEAQREIANARLLVLPSRCYEGFPMVIREAFAFGTPVAVSNLGPLPSIVTHGENGLVFEPGDPQSLFETVQRAWNVPGGLEALSAHATKAFEADYTENVNYQRLMEIYRSAQEVSRRRASK